MSNDVQFFNYAAKYMLFRSKFNISIVCFIVN
jgi:hypothetical protein